MAYRNRFEEMYKNEFISVSVDPGDIDPDNEADHIKRLIQQDHIVQSSVVVALYGAETYKRKHVDWEISGGLSERVGGRKGFIVFLLPTFPVAPYDALNRYAPHLIYPYLHERTVANLRTGYADLHFWPGLHTHYPGVTTTSIQDIVQNAFKKRASHAHLIDNSALQYQRNLA
jgi:hypothetical protein